MMLGSCPIDCESKTEVAAAPETVDAEAGCTAYDKASGKSGKISNLSIA